MSTSISYIFTSNIAIQHPVLNLEENYKRLCQIRANWIPYLPPVQYGYKPLLRYEEDDFDNITWSLIINLCENTQKNKI